MPIILAIEPDRRQAAHLTGIVRQRVGAELILADTTEGALDAIGNRIPDMVLVPAFLSPQDDAALAAALRVIAAAAHVRTLTIPVLSSGEKQAAPGGILAKWRRARAESPAPDGCDPAVFAEQITAYLNEAAAERAELEVEPDEAAEIAPIVEAPPVELVTPVVEAVESMVLPTALPLAAAPAPANDDENVTDDDEGAIDLSAELTFLSEGKDDAHEATDDERFAGEPVGVYSIETAVGEPAPVAEEAVVEETVVEEAPRPRADLTPWTVMYLTPGRMWPTLEGVQAEALPPVDECPPEPEPIAARPRHLEWTELVASLRQDIERRRAEPVPASAPPVAARAASAAAVRGSQPDTRQKRRGKKMRPAQDEWGFFDPEQCGFAALLAKLEEITVSPDPTDDDARRPA